MNLVAAIYRVLWVTLGLGALACLMAAFQHGDFGWAFIALMLGALSWGMAKRE